MLITFDLVFLWKMFDFELFLNVVSSLVNFRVLSQIVLTSDSTPGAKRRKQRFGRADFWDLDFFVCWTSLSHQGTSSFLNQCILDIWLKTPGCGADSDLVSRVLVEAVCVFHYSSLDFLTYLIFLFVSLVFCKCVLNFPSAALLRGTNAWVSFPLDRSFFKNNLDFDLKFTSITITRMKVK